MRPISKGQENERGLCVGGWSSPVSEQTEKSEGMAFGGRWRRSLSFLPLPLQRERSKSWRASGGCEGQSFGEKEPDEGHVESETEATVGPSQVGESSSGNLSTATLCLVNSAPSSLHDHLQLGTGTLAQSYRFVASRHAYMLLVHTKKTAIRERCYVVRYGSRRRRAYRA